MEQYMQAGRALDKLVADRVMGWKVFESEMDSGRPPNSPISLVLKPFPHYSTDISAAWEVFDQGIFRFGQASILADIEDYGRGAILGDGPERVVAVVIGGWAVTAPICEAICLAALAACGVDIAQS